MTIVVWRCCLIYCSFWLQPVWVHSLPGGWPTFLMGVLVAVGWSLWLWETFVHCSVLPVSTILLQYCTCCSGLFVTLFLVVCYITYWLPGIMGSLVWIDASGWIVVVLVLVVIWLLRLVGDYSRFYLNLLVVFSQSLVWREVNSVWGRSPGCERSWEEEAGWGEGWGRTCYTTFYVLLFVFFISIPIWEFTKFEAVVVGRWWWEEQLLMTLWLMCCCCWSDPGGGLCGLVCGWCVWPCSSDLVLFGDAVMPHVQAIWNPFIAVC